MKNEAEDERSSATPIITKDAGSSQCTTLLDLESVRNAMEPLHQFLTASFSSSPTNSTSFEGYLYGTTRHVSITFDVFSIFIYRLPDGETFQSTLFVDGKQYDTKQRLMEEIKLLRNEVLAFAISLALQDTDLLIQMGLIQPVNPYLNVEFELDEIEILPLRRGSALFSGTYSNTVMARRAVTLLALTGLRKASYETVLDDKDGWDIYDMASGGSIPGMKHPLGGFIVVVGAICCALIQIVVPVFLIYRGLQEDMDGELSRDVYLARLFFGVYAVYYEAKTWAVDNGDRVTGWLCFLPEFSTRKFVIL